MKFIKRFSNMNFFQRMGIILKIIIIFSMIYLPITYLFYTIYPSLKILMVIPLLGGFILFEINIFFSFYYFIFKKVLRKFQLSKEDFVKSKTYYRDLINNYDLIELSYIDDFKLEKKDLVVILLNMELKGIISLKEGKITIIDSSKAKKNAEKYILSNINQSKLIFNKDSLFEIEEKVKKDCLTDQLIRRNFDIVFVSLFVVLFILNIFPNIIHLFSFFITLLAIILQGAYTRTEKGHELNGKLEGLKKYLKDFSSLDTKEHKEIVLWEEYLIFSILFNQNKKIVSEISENYMVK